MSRHCKAVDIQLEELRNAFTTLNTSHDENFTGYKQDIVQLEGLFASATKSTKFAPWSFNDLYFWIFNPKRVHFFELRNLKTLSKPCFKIILLYTCIAIEQ